MNRFGLFLATLALQLGVMSQVRAESFTYTGTIQTYTVATTGNYYISASGAQGSAGYGYGGLGAALSGNYVLTAGTVLDIVVGGQLAHDTGGEGGGGGGGTYVYIANASSPLLVAGGGGGGGYSILGGAGQTGTAGQAGLGPYAGAGGTNGSGGQGGTVGISDGGGGAGWFSSGTGGDDRGGYGGSNGPSFAGGAGDSVDGTDTYGGYGGGGGGGNNGGGGGGGYSGGGGGGGDGSGGGGGSFLDAAFTNISVVGGSNSGNGSATISLASAAVPEPSTFVLLGTGLAGLVAYRWRRRQPGVSA